MTQSDTATFTLSQEEVYFVLAQVRAKGLLGVDPAPLAVFTAEQRQAVLAAAGRALHARDLIVTAKDGALRLDGVLRAAIHAAAFAPRSLTMLLRNRDELTVDAYIVHHADPLWVEHTQPGPGLHAFALSSERPPVSVTLAELLGAHDQPAPPAAPFVIDQTQLEHLQVAAHDNDEVTVARLLGAAGADTPTVRCFTALLSQPRESAILQALNRNGPLEQTRTVTVLQNADGFWMLESVDLDHLRCEPASAAEVRRMLDSLAEQL